MADVFDFYVYDNRSIVHTSPEPIMQEDKDVAVWRFRIPKVLNNIDMSAWAWWFVYVNARGQKFSELLTLSNDIDDPDNYCTVDYSIGYGISKTPGGFTFALEAINTSQGGEISGEWHTRTYTHTVTPTLQGNQAEHAETESDIISALIVEVQNKINSLIGGATPLVVSSVSAMTDTSKIYVLSTDGNWYYHNGTTWVSGGTYASGITIDPTLTQSGEAADAKETGDRIDGINKSIESLSVVTDYDFNLIANNNWPLGWRNGYFDRTTGAINSDNTRYIRTVYDKNNPLTVQGAYKVIAKAPAGYAVSIVVYDENGVFARSYGNNNSSSTEGTNEITASLNPGENIGLTVGIFPSGTASNYLTTEFISQITLRFFAKNHGDTAEEFDFNLIANDNWPLGWRNGYFDRTTGVTNSSNTRYIRTLYDKYNVLTVKNAVKVFAKAPAGYAVSIVVYDQDGKFLRSYGNNNSSSADATNAVTAALDEGENIGLTVGIFPSGTAADYLTEEFISQIILRFFVTESSEINDKIPVKDTSLVSVVCAKETNYSDGTFPTVEFYLLMGKNRTFYITKDFATTKEVFTAPFDPLKYKYAIMQNGDVIAVYRSEQFRTGGSDANNRKNPYVFLASEKYSVAHEVDFDDSLKPSGWLENCGFCSMPNGDALFCEYTRPGVETANCWKLSGDITDPNNWVVKKSFALSGLENEGFKHCHAVSYDFYTDVYYLATGDDDIGAQLWYSTDNGETWTLTRAASEKYCRMLNMIFTEDYIYWASDTTQANMHYLFRCERDANDIIDYSTITELADLTQSGVATYGISFLRELNALVILDYCDSDRTEMPLKIYDITNNQLVTMGVLSSVDGNTRKMGFRTEYSEYNPNSNSILFGFGTTHSIGHYENLIKGLGNVYSTTYYERVNNMKIVVYRKSNGFGFFLRSAFTK